MNPGDISRPQSLTILGEPPGTEWQRSVGEVGDLSLVSDVRWLHVSTPRHRRLIKLQGVGHGDKIIIIWNILISVEDRPGSEHCFGLHWAEQWTVRHNSICKKEIGQEPTTATIPTKWPRGLSSLYLSDDVHKKVSSFKSNILTLKNKDFLEILQSPLHCLT